MAGTCACGGACHWKGRSRWRHPTHSCWQAAAGEAPSACRLLLPPFTGQGPGAGVGKAGKARPSPLLSYRFWQALPRHRLFHSLMPPRALYARACYSHGFSRGGPRGAEAFACTALLLGRGQALVQEAAAQAACVLRVSHSHTRATFLAWRRARACGEMLGKRWRVGRVVLFSTKVLERA